MKPRSRLLTLTTDYGTRDGYAGAIKGAVLSLAPSVSIHDISHQIAPQGIWEGAWCLRRAVPRFPSGSTHLAVVDPGVGSGRSGVVIETERHVLIGPDNGVLTLAARDDGIRRVFEIDEEVDSWHRSDTFDGLTLFAPVAGLLLSGMALEEVGPELEDLVELTERQALLQGDTIEGSVMLFDHFGNAITDIRASLMQGRQVAEVSLKEFQDVRFCGNYGDLAGSPVIGCLVNSDGLLELALFGASLQQRHNLEIGDPVRVQLK